MNLYLLGRTTECDYDQYDSAVVVAQDETDAKSIHPNGSDEVVEQVTNYDSWVPLSQVTVKLIGTAHPDLIRGVVCASYNAG